MNFVKQPWPHQEAAIQEAIRVYEEAKDYPEKRAGYALFFEPRCGKTGVAINVLRYICNAEKKKLRTLIFCPPRVVPNWKVEFSIHSKFEQEKVVLLQGSGERRLSHFRKRSADGAHIFVTNYESLLMADLFEAFQEWKPEFVIADESHRCKDHKAKRSKTLEKLCNPRSKIGSEQLIRSAPYTMILTGSPILNNLMDLYEQFKILDGGSTFGYQDYRTKRWEPLTFRGFLMTFFIDKNAGMPKQKYFPKWELRPGAKEEITKLIRPKSMRVERKDVLDLPPTERVVIETEMTQAQKKLYGEMKRDFITWYKSEAVVARLALTKSLRLLQITSGFVKTEEGKEIYLDEIPKQRALQELLEDVLPSGKCLVWSVFKENYRQIREVCESLGVEFVEVHGEVSSRQQDINVRRFQTEEKVRVFIGHPESGGEGINLVQAPYNIFYSRTHSLKHSIQASARNQSADSQHAKTTRYDLVARGTLDSVVADIVTEKEAMAQEVYAELILKNLLDCNLQAD